jgi:hypothetical protein
MILVKPHGAYIAAGKKTVVVKSRAFRAVIDKPLLLVERKMALGLVRLTNFREGDLGTFTRLQRRHMVTTAERKLWWPRKRTLYFYDVVIDRIFSKPLPIEYGTGPQVFVKPENIHFTARGRSRRRT